VRKRKIDLFIFLQIAEGKGRKSNKKRGEEEGFPHKKLFVRTKQLSCAEPCSTLHLVHYYRTLEVIQLLMNHFNCNSMEEESAAYTSGSEYPCD
jgi:hypothetical protein